jgi:hypothetical protein
MTLNQQNTLKFVDTFICMATDIVQVIFMALSPPKKNTWYLCIVLWIIGVILAFGFDKYALYGSVILALSGLLSILAVYFRGL